MTIHTWPQSAFLRLSSKEVTEFDSRKVSESQPLRNLIVDMGETMYSHKGLGLAAVQVGHLSRLIVLRDPEGVQPTAVGSKPQHRWGVFALLNPRIIESSEETEVEEEGCLSLPGVSVEVERPVSVKVEHETAFGETIQAEAWGLEARTLQHEIDHTNGILIIDHLDADERKAVIRRMAATRPFATTAFVG